MKRLLLIAATLLAAVPANARAITGWQCDGVQVFIDTQKGVGPSLKYVAEFELMEKTAGATTRFEWRWLPEGGSEVYLNGKLCEVHLLGDGWPDESEDEDAK